MKQSLWIALIFGWLTNSGAMLLAQGFQMAQPLGIGGPSMKEDFEPAMRLEVDLIRRVTGLSDAATKKLELAAVAAVNSAARKLETQAQSVPLPMIAPLPEDELAPKSNGNTLSDEDAEKARQPDTFEAMQAPFMFNATALDEILDEEIWKKTLQNTLTSEQRFKYDAFLAERKQKRRQQSVLQKVHDLDRHLQFSPDQWEAIISLVDRVLGDDLESQFKGFGGAPGALARSL